ncbi:hypothetical protein BC936DRAFT_137626 [Jimgerdemannia flammicorona]|uniref:DNA-directed DNA polymerase n=1 Tax=Jimgerdemannia flammicorona TaxID=994334 RepID=A0A433DIZ0_9FUNG|nr:hypothetical protein BC936DRAFT_137626 [Jimgerdemannia flammicorona]
MTLPMPLNYLDRVPGLDIHLSCFTGFVRAKVSLREGGIPTIPHHLQLGDRLSYPQTPFEGLFYAPELFDASQHGYDVTIQYGYLFSTADLFTEYVTHMYNKKVAATEQPELRFIYKLLLNGLYGYFGRRLFNPTTIIVNDTDLANIISRYSVSFTTELNSKYSIVTYDPSYDREKGSTIPLRPASANVAIASAITSLARWTINPFKRDPNNPVFYSDTDSIFVQFPLSDSLVGTGLGQ